MAFGSEHRAYSPAIPPLEQQFFPSQDCLLVSIRKQSICCIYSKENMGDIRSTQRTTTCCQ
jgi:hypothetical protein